MVNQFLEKCKNEDYSYKISTVLNPLNAQAIDAYISSNWSALLPTVKKDK